MEFNFTPHTVTLYNQYAKDGEIKFKRTVIDKCKFTTRDNVILGSTQVKSSDNGKLFIYEDNLNMGDYKLPKDFDGDGFTINTEDLVVIGQGPEITSTKDLRDFEHYTIVSVLRNDYSFYLPHHFSIEVS